MKVEIHGKTATVKKDDQYITSFDFDLSYIKEIGNYATARRLEKNRSHDLSDLIGSDTRRGLHNTCNKIAYIICDRYNIIDGSLAKP